MKKNIIICGLLLMVMCLVAILSPQPVVAQDLQLQNRTFGNTVKAGENNPFFVEVGNRSNVPITDIVFSSYQPGGWVVEFRPGRIDSLAARSSQTIDVNIKPPARATPGQYRVTLIAEAVEVREVMDMSVVVGTSDNLELSGGT